MSKTKFLVFWSPYEEVIHFSKTNYFQDLFEQDQSIVVVDLKNNKDPRSLSLLREADLVVVFLKQDVACLNQYFLYDLVRNEHIIYVIADYIYDARRDWSHELELYRIPQDTLFFLPYSPHLQPLHHHDDVEQLLKEGSSEMPYEFDTGFWKNCRLLRTKIYQSLR